MVIEEDENLRMRGKVKESRPSVSLASPHAAIPLRLAPDVSASRIDRFEFVER